MDFESHGQKRALCSSMLCMKSKIYVYVYKGTLADSALYATLGKIHTLEINPQLYSLNKCKFAITFEEVNIKKKKLHFTLNHLLWPQKAKIIKNIIFITLVRISCNKNEIKEMLIWYWSIGRKLNTTCLAKPRETERISN